MRVLVDRHHGVLLEGLSMLFEDRFGWELAVWADGDYVKARSLHSDFPPRRIVVHDAASARDWRPDIVLSTVGGTRYRMRALASEVGAEYVDQVGNAWDQPLSKRVLWSVSHDAPLGVTYHPEFHRVPWHRPAGKRVGAFHANFATSPCRTLWDRAAASFPDHEFVLYGTPERMLYPYQVVEAMASCVAIWHCKDADGYGFTVHEAFAAGRGIVGHAAHYAGKLAEPLFAAGAVEPDQIGQVLENPERWGRAARASFERTIDFEAEAAEILAYLTEGSHP